MFVNCGCKGTALFQAVSDKIRRLAHCLLLEGLSKPYSLHEEMDVTIGGFDGILPFGREIERYVMEGDLFSILHVAIHDIVKQWSTPWMIYWKGEWKNDGKKEIS